jgi:soluble lytic murein transglycosylase-like protein
MHDEGRHVAPSEDVPTVAICPLSSDWQPAVPRAYAPPAPARSIAPLTPAPYSASLAPSAPAPSAPVAYPTYPSHGTEPRRIETHRTEHPRTEHPRDVRAGPRTAEQAAVTPAPRRHAARTAPTKNNAVVSATAALGAVVTGGLLASQATGTFALADASDSAHKSELAAAAAMPLELQPASNITPLSASDMGDAPASATALLPVALGDRDSMADRRDVEALHRGETLGVQAAAVHAAAAREAHVLAGGGGLNDWISVALDKLGLDQAMATGVRRIIMQESRGNPHAVNHWDSNAMAGRPSQGLMQVIPSTFRAYVLPELRHRPITDPVANITAGIRYMIANYGLGTLRAGGRHMGGSYVGY